MSGAKVGVVANEHVASADTRIRDAACADRLDDDGQNIRLSRYVRTDRDELAVRQGDARACVVRPNQNWRSGRPHVLDSHLFSDVEEAMQYNLERDRVEFPYELGHQRGFACRRV